MNDPKVNSLSIFARTLKFSEGLMDFFKISLWHASVHDFKSFDFKKIGSTSLRQGYGFYFSRNPEHAKRHVPNARFLYKIKISRLAYGNLLRLNQRLSSQNKIIQRLARTLENTPPLANWANKAEFDVLYADGESLYKAACVEAGKNMHGVSYERAGVKLLRSNGILGSTATMYGEEIVVLYCPNLVSSPKKITL